MSYNEDQDEEDRKLHNADDIVIEEVDISQNDQLENQGCDNIINESIINTSSVSAQYFEMVNSDKSDIIKVERIIEEEGCILQSNEAFMEKHTESLTDESIGNDFKYAIVNEEEETNSKLYVYSFPQDHQMSLIEQENVENNSESDINILLSEQYNEQGSLAEDDMIIQNNNAIQAIAKETEDGDIYINLLENIHNSTNAEAINSLNFEEHYIEEDAINMYIENPSIETECIVSSDTENNLLEDASRASIHTCTYCNKSYVSNDQLLKHLDVCRNRQQDESYNCWMCDIELKNVHDLIEHKKQKHQCPDTGRFRCPNCETTCLNERILRTHVKMHTSPMCFRCEICHKNFRRKSNMENHHATHVYDFPCPVCCNSYNTEFHLTRHLALHTEESVRESTSNPSYMICDFKENCGEKFYSKLKYYVHKKSHLNVVDYKCDKCNKRYKSETILANHKKTHEGSRMCGDCGKILSNEKTFKEHLRLHTGEMPFKCKECDHSFRCQSSLAVHMLSHTGVKNYKCMYCQQAFTRSTYLKDHLRIHTNDKPYICPYCKQCYAQAGVMNKHVATMHRKCNICDEIVGDKTKLQVHMWKLHSSKELNYAQNIDMLLLNDNQFLVGEERVGI